VRIDLLVRDAVDHLEIPFDSLGVDAYGTSRPHLRFALTVFAALYRGYFSVETRGIEHVPARGRAMLVGNHSGGIAIDATMVIASCLLEMRPPRLAQGMAEKFISRLPFLSEWATRIGQLPGIPEHAELLLADDRLLMVFPEGARGTGKLFKDRYSLVEFGSGFMRLALKTKSPIVPFAVLGGGEAFPTVANAYKVGKAFGLPYLPIVAYGIPVPIPAKIEIEYGAPMQFAGTGNEDDEVVLGHVSLVREQISRMLTEGVMRRRGGAAAARDAAVMHGPGREAGGDPGGDPGNVGRPR
jgi:1-acyl-sn-glycerol-3-phosphate acyltransferase